MVNLSRWSSILHAALHVDHTTQKSIIQPTGLITLSVRSRSNSSLLLPEPSSLATTNGLSIDLGTPATEMVHFAGGFKAPPAILGT